MPQDGYSEPDIPVKEWYVSMCKESFLAHNILFDGKVNEFRVEIIKRKQDTIQLSVLKEMVTCNVIKINRLIGSLLSMNALQEP